MSNHSHFFYDPTTNTYHEHGHRSSQYHGHASHSLRRTCGAGHNSRHTNTSSRRASASHTGRNIFDDAFDDYYGHNTSTSNSGTRASSRHRSRSPSHFRRHRSRSPPQQRRSSTAGASRHNAIVIDDVHDVRRARAEQRRAETGRHEERQAAEWEAFRERNRRMGEAHRAARRLEDPATAFEAFRERNRLRGEAHHAARRR